MKENLKREDLRKYLEEYRKHLHKIRKGADAHRSGYSEITGAITAVNYLLSEVRKERV